MLRVFDCRLKSVSIEYPSVPQGPSQFNTSFPHKNHTFSMPKIPQFNTENPSVQHQNPSVQHTPQFNTPLSSTPKTLSSTHPSVPHQKPLSSTKFLSEGCIEPLRGFWCGAEGGRRNSGVCWTEGFRVLKSSGPFVWNWNVELRGCGTEGDPFQLSFSEKKNQAQVGR